MEGDAFQWRVSLGSERGHWAGVVTTMPSAWIPNWPVWEIPGCSQRKERGVRDSVRVLHDRDVADLFLSGLPPALPPIVL